MNQFPFMKTYVAVNKDGTEIISNYKLELVDDIWCGISENAAGQYDNYTVQLPNGTIEKIIGYKLTFEKSPIQL